MLMITMSRAHQVTSGDQVFPQSSFGFATSPQRPQSRCHLVLLRKFLANATW